MKERDRVYFWAGTEWFELIAPSTVAAEEIRREIMAEGYEAVTGLARIGAPEGPPPGPGLKRRRR